MKREGSFKISQHKSIVYNFFLFNNVKDSYESI